MALLETDNPTNKNHFPAKLPSKGGVENEKIYVYGYPRQTILGKSETSEGEILSLTAKGDRSKIIISGNLHVHHNFPVYPGLLCSLSNLCKMYPGKPGIGGQSRDQSESRQNPVWRPS